MEEVRASGRDFSEGGRMRMRRHVHIDDDSIDVVLVLFEVSGCIYTL